MVTSKAQWRYYHSKFERLYSQSLRKLKQAQLHNGKLHLSPVNTPQSYQKYFVCDHVHANFEFDRTRIFFFKHRFQFYLFGAQVTLKVDQGH